MGSRDGWVVADWPIVRIVVGHRQRKDLGDIAELMDSMRTLGQLQPITVTPEGILICGGRRLEAARRLGWGRVAVWVRDGLSEPLERLLAEQHENTMRKPFTPAEAAAMYQELKAVLAEAAAAREQATQFGSAHRRGLAESATPHGPEPRVRAAQLVTGRKSYTMLEQVSELQRAATNPRTPEKLRTQAIKSLARIEADGKVHGHYQDFKAAKQRFEKTREPLEDPMTPERKARNRARSFMGDVRAMRGWTKGYDPAALGHALNAGQVEILDQLAAETAAIAEAIHAAQGS